MSADLEQEILTVLRSKMPRAEQVTKLAELIIEFGEPEPVIYEAWPLQTRVEVERVEAYGLEIGLDAHGNACRVEFPYGAETVRDE